MAAAIVIPLVAVAIQALGPEIPVIVQSLERLFGHSTDTGKKDGPSKMQAGVSILTALLAVMANAAKIPSAAAVDPALPAGLAGALQQAFNGLKAQGLLDGPALMAPVAAVLPLVAPAVVLKPGLNILVSA